MFNFIKSKFLEHHQFIDKEELDEYITFIMTIKEIKEKHKGEIHHVLPKAKDLFPQFRLKSEAPWNQKRISSGDHLRAHYLLWRAFPNIESISYPFYRMNKNNRLELKIEEYEKSKEMQRKLASDRIKGSKHPAFGKISPTKGRKKSIAECKLISFSKKEKFRTDGAHRERNKIINKITSNTPEERKRRSISQKNILIRPWFHPKVKSSQKLLCLWARADEIYKIWILNKKCQHHKLKNIVGIEGRNPLRAMIEYFKRQGDPALDPIWIILSQQQPA